MIGTFTLVAFMTLNRETDFITGKCKVETQMMNAASCITDLLVIKENGKVIKRVPLGGVMTTFEVQQLIDAASQQYGNTMTREREKATPGPRVVEPVKGYSEPAFYR
jgi:hypothetical protein